MRSTSSSTTSPGCKNRSCSRPQPLPTVPEPKNSPGCSVSERATWAMQSSNFHFMSRELPRPHSSPFTRTFISRAYGSGISSAVTRNGPMAFALSKSFALAGSELAGHLLRLLVARREVVEDRVAEDVVAPALARDVLAGAPDVEAELELEVERVAIHRPRHVVVVPAHAE